MKAVEAIDEDMAPLQAAPIQPDIAPEIALETTSALEEERVRDVLRSASAILSDAASSLYSSELEVVRGDLDIDEPDDDRMAGRLDYARLDLMSE